MMCHAIGRRVILILNERRLGPHTYGLLIDERPTGERLAASQRRLDPGTPGGSMDIHAEALKPLDRCPPMARFIGNPLKNRAGAVTKR
jgi:hypothetical protein